MNERQKLLDTIRALEFSLIELQLFLDTHPYDSQAIKKYNEYINEVTVLRREYQSKYGPLIANSSVTNCPWQWIQGWPWQVYR